MRGARFNNSSSEVEARRTEKSSSAFSAGLHDHNDTAREILVGNRRAENRERGDHVAGKFAMQHVPAGADNNRCTRPDQRHQQYGIRGARCRRRKPQHETGSEP